MWQQPSPTFGTTPASSAFTPPSPHQPAMKSHYQHQPLQTTSSSSSSFSSTLRFSHSSPPPLAAPPSSPTTSPHATTSSHPSSSLYHAHFHPIRRRQPFGGFDARGSNTNSPTNETTTAPSPSSTTTTTTQPSTSKARNTAPESVYERTMRMLMTANQNVVLMEEEEEEVEEDINVDSVGEGQRSILDFFGRRRNEEESNQMEED